MGSRTTVRPGSGADRWFEIKSQIHQKLLNSLTPEQLKTLNKDSVREQIGTVVERLVLDESHPDDAGRARAPHRGDPRRSLRPRPARSRCSRIPPSATSWSTASTTSTSSAAGRLVETNIRFKDQAHVRMIIERIVSNHRPPHRRFVAHRGRAPGRRLARLRRDSAAVADRAGDVDPPLRQEAAHHRRSAEERDLHHRHARLSERLRGGAAEHRDLRRFGLRARPRC